MRRWRWGGCCSGAGEAAEALEVLEPVVASDFVAAGLAARASLG